MRIAFLDSWRPDPARGSGSAVAISGLARALRSLGHSVDHLRPRTGRPGRILTRLLFNAGLPFRLDPREYELVVGFDLDGFLLESRGSRGTLRVASLKGIAADEMRFESGATRLRFALLATLEARNARRADRVVVTSRYSRRVAMEAYELPAEKLRVVPEGIDLRAWERPPEPGPERPSPTVLTVARHYPRKNTIALLRALPDVRDSVPGVRLRIVGGGPRLPALRAQARRLGIGGAVTFLGEIGDRAAVRREYFGADLFCLPSLQEGFGLVFLEAMAAGLPVVALRTAAVPEVVPDGEAGILVPPGDRERLAGAVTRILADPELRRRMGAAGREHARRFRWTEVARRFLRATAPSGLSRRRPPVSLEPDEPPPT